MKKLFIAWFCISVFSYLCIDSNWFSLTTYINDFGTKMPNWLNLINELKNDLNVGVNTYPFIEATDILSILANIYNFFAVLQTSIVAIFKFVIKVPLYALKTIVALFDLPAQFGGALNV